MLIAVFDGAAARTANAYHSKTGTPRGAASLPALGWRQQKRVVDYVVQGRQAAQTKATIRAGKTSQADLELLWAVIALEWPAGPRASCAPPRPASEVRPATAFAVPRTSWGRSA